MHDRIHTSKPLIGEPPPEGFDRDPRIDACRGIALWWIFLDHIPNNIGSWLTLRNYGFSDAAELFMFISGVTCALAYGRARLCEGWGSVIRRSLLRVPNVTLGASLLLYALVHVFGWTVPAWPNNVWFFNPLAWQLLIVLGAWWVIEGKRLRPWVTSRTALVLAVLYLAFGLIIALSWRIKSLEPLVPQTLTNLRFPADKSDLSPLRVLHFLALAILAVRFVPHTWRGLMTPVMRGAMRCGENSLPIYFLGVLLAVASHVALLDISDGLPMQIALSLGGILMMIIAAMLLNSIRIKPKWQPPSR
jgi:hypothetical protein